MPITGGAAAGGAGLYDAYVNVRDKKTSGTAGGTFTSGAWYTRAINEELADTANICSIASDQITLAAGTYRCLISAPAMQVNRHQARLYNVTDDTVLILGSNAYTTQASSAAQTHAFVAGRFTLSAQKTLEIQHRCYATESTDGMGLPASWGDEIYTVAEFWREA